MHTKLYEAGAVIAGYTFRGAIIPDDVGSTCVFQAKDLVQGVPFEDTGSLTRVSHDAPGYSGHLRNNDVLLVARGMKAGSFRSTVFRSNALNVIASSSVHVIRITKPHILPEYVSLYLNSKNGQQALTEIVSGSYIGALPRSALGNIEIPVPTVEKQKILVDLFSNIRDQQRILERERELKESIINSAFQALTAK